MNDVDGTKWLQYKVLNNETQDVFNEMHSDFVNGNWDPNGMTVADITGDKDNSMYVVPKSAFLQSVGLEEGKQIETVNEILVANKAEDVIEKKCDFKEVDIIKLIEDSIFDFSGETHPKEIEILFLKPDKESVTVLADKEKLRIVFQNLLENAIKYSNKKGKIFIVLKNYS